jgi:hypothetical protein
MHDNNKLTCRTCSTEYPSRHILVHEADFVRDGGNLHACPRCNKREAQSGSFMIGVGLGLFAILVYAAFFW